MLLEDLEEAILAMGPETICLVHMEPVQNAGGAFTPPEGYWRGVRELCDRYDILLSADEVITAFGARRPLVRLRALRHPSRHRLLREGALVRLRGHRRGRSSTDKVMEPFLEGASMYSHGITFGGHPVMSAIALKNIEIMKRERIMERVLGNEDAFRVDARDSCSTCRSSATCAAPATSTRSSSSRTRRRARRSTTRSARRSCADTSRRALFERGLICRADDRGDPVIQISPPLIAGQAEFDEIVGILGDVLAEAGKRMLRSSALRKSVVNRPPGP